MSGRIVLGGGIAAAAAAGLGCAIARRLTALVGQRTFDLTIRSVEHDDNGDLIVLDRTEQTTAPGIYNLWFENGGWAQLWSMGAAIALQLADHPRHQGLIAALVLDSPVLNWTEVMKTNCARSGLPAAAGYLAIPWLTLHPLARAVGLPGRIPLRSFDWSARSADLTTPTLILHGTRDDSVPIQLSEALRDARPDLVELETFDAGHTLCWNTGPDRWHETVISWLKAIDAGDAAD